MITWYVTSFSELTLATLLSEHQLEIWLAWFGTTCSVYLVVSYRFLVTLTILIVLLDEAGNCIQCTLVTFVNNSINCRYDGYFVLSEIAGKKIVRLHLFLMNVLCFNVLKFAHFKLWMLLKFSIE